MRFDGIVGVFGNQGRRRRRGSHGARGGMFSVDANQATVFVIDDDPSVRDALTRLLRSVGWGASTFENAQHFLDEAPVDTEGCILLDVNMPGMNGLDLHDRLRELGIGLPVIYLTGDCTVSMGVRAMKHGAVDFLEKPIDEAQLLPAIDEALARQRRLRAEGERLDDVRARTRRLSTREREVMDHVIAGRLNKQIAADLGIAEKTVKVHRGRVMSKMQVRSVAQLVRLCDDMGIGR